MIQISKLDKDNTEYLEEVKKLSKEATNYLEAFKWCDKIENSWLVKNWGYILCVFYFKIKPTKNSGADDFVWIIVGDVPPAYIDIETADTAYKALENYIFLMNEWAGNIVNNKSVEECYPVNVPPEKKYAKMLLKRLQLLETDYLPELVNISIT